MTELNHPWPLIPLGTLAAEMCLGKMLDKNKNRGTLHPYLRNVNVRWFTFDLGDLKQMRFEPGEESRFGLREGDLVICEGGEPGRAAVWRGQAADARIQKALHRVRFRLDEYDPSFAMYFLYYGTSSPRFARYYTGSTIKHLTGESLAQIPFPVAPLNEQRRIVAKLEELLSNLDAGVAALKRAKANLKRYRASVLKAAVEGRLTAEWRAKHPHAEPATRLLDRILSERRRRWEAEQEAKFAAAVKTPPQNWRDKYQEPGKPHTPNLPELPPGWCWVTVDQLLVQPTCNGISVKGRDEPPGVPALRLSAMSDSGFDYTQRRYIPISDELAAALQVREGDFFVARGNGSLHLVGRGTLAQSPPDLVVFPDTMIRVRLPANAVSASYIALVWQSRILRNQIEKVARTTAGIYKISQRDVESFVIPLPPQDEQAQILSEYEERTSTIQITDEQQIAHGLLRAVRLRQSLLKRAFEGKLVPQDPTDEPASVLLERIRAGRQPVGGNGVASPKARRPRKEPR